MKLPTLLFVSWTMVGVGAFSSNPIPISMLGRSTNAKMASSKGSQDHQEEPSWQNQVGRFLATGLVTASLWAAPAMLIQQTPSWMMMDSSSWTLSSVANAKQMASASGSRVNKDPESLLRYGLPINSQEVCCVCV